MRSESTSALGQPNEINPTFSELSVILNVVRGQEVGGVQCTFDIGAHSKLSHLPVAVGADFELLPEQ